MITLNYRLQRFLDLDSLSHFLIVYKGSGGCLFYHPFKETEIQPDLISGFISAMGSMFGEFTGSGREETVESLKYQGMILNGFNGKYVIGILIAERDVSSSFNLKGFIEGFESRYDTALQDWQGELFHFEHEWIVKHLCDCVSYDDNLPYVVTSTKPKKQYSTTIVYLKSLCDSLGRFVFRDVLIALKKFLKISEAYAFDVLMRFKYDGVIAPVPFEEYLEMLLRNKVAIEELSLDTQAMEAIGDSSTDLAEVMDESKIKEISELESYASDAQAILTDAPESDVRVLDDGTYSLDREVSLDNLILTDGDGWLRDIASEAITSYLGQYIIVSNSKYTPISHDPEKGTVTIRIFCYIDSD
ncbi:MAG: hypothetical protein ACTSQZ_03560 [Candidatus Thorarchaeota archaeon]